MEENLEIPGEMKRLEDIPEEMKRLVLVKKRRQLAQIEFRIEIVPVPKPSDGEVLVRMVSAPLNPSDFSSWISVGDQEEILLDEPKPIGSEGAGIVVSSGAGLGVNLIGKAIVVHTLLKEGTYQEYVCVPAHPALIIPDGTAIESACSAFINPFTAVAMLETVRQHDSKVFIITAAASALGQMVLRLSNAKGLKMVSIVRKRSQVELLKSLGAENIVDTSDANWKDQLSKLIEKLRITVAFDALAGDMTGTILRMLPAQSHVYVYGALSGEPVGNIDPIDLIYKRKEIHGFLMRDWVKQGHLIWETINEEEVHTRAFFRRASEEVMPNLVPGKWAATSFADCTMETMHEALVQSTKGGMKNAKLRIRFGTEKVKMKQEALGSA